MGGFLPSRRPHSTEKLKTPELDLFEPLLKNSGDREISTTMAFVRLLNILLKDKEINTSEIICSTVSYNLKVENPIYVLVCKKVFKPSNRGVCAINNPNKHANIIVIVALF